MRSGGHVKMSRKKIIKGLIERGSAKWVSEARTIRSTTFCLLKVSQTDIKESAPGLAR